MLTWGCEQVRAELSAYYDEELSVKDQIAISDHLDRCPSCRLEADDLELIGGALQATARVEDVAVMPGLSRLQTDVLERWNAEERASFGRSVRNLFDDPRRVSASVGVSLVASLFLAMASFLLAPTPVRRTADIYLPALETLPRAQAEAIMPATVMNRDDEEVAFAALVTADGYLEDVTLIGDRVDGRRSLPTHAELSELLNAVATARFEPARAAGAPVSQNVVWLVSHTTVRAPLRAYIHVRVDGWKML